MIKTCKKCLIEKGIILFSKDKTRKDGLRDVCKSCCKEQWGAYYSSEEGKNKVKEYRLQNKEYFADYQRKRHKRTNELRSQNSKKKKELVYIKYGNKCNCCGETEPAFLTIDHINNNGAKHRKDNPSIRTGARTYQWLIKNNYPKDFQLLCWNCNCSKGQLGYCPHTLNR